MTDIVTGITAALDITKKLRDLDKKVGEADFKMLLADLTSELGDAKLAAANLKIELASVTDENIRLKADAQRKIDTDPDIDDGAYIFGDKSRHYCTACFDIRHQKVLLSELSGAFTAFGKWKCPSCDKTFGPAR